MREPSRRNPTLLLVIALLGCDPDVDKPVDTPAPEPTVDTTTTTDTTPPWIPPVIQPDPCINEVMPDNQTGLLDEAGARPDWIELHNPGTEDVSLDGWELDDVAPNSAGSYLYSYAEDPSLDPTLVIPAGGYLLLYADGHPELGPQHLDFTLEAMGEGLQLVKPDDTGTRVSWGATGGDRAVARFGDCCTGSEECFRYPLLGTPGASNASATATIAVVRTDAAWRYLDLGARPALGWTLPGFDDSAWKVGAGPLGYGEIVATVVDAGPDPAAPYTTTWLRTTFDVAAPVSAARLRVRRDDGAAVRLDGRDVYWENLPNDPDPALPATAAVKPADEMQWREISVAPELLGVGTHTLAAEVRQATADGGDLYFELELLVEYAP